MLDLNAEYICPYCANKEVLSKYLIKKANGEYNQKKAKCPLCLENMKMAILTANMSPEEWGEWLYLNIRVYNSPHFKFYDKWQHDIFFLNFNIFNRDIRNDWWMGFKKYKGLSDIRTLKDRLEELNLKFGIFKTPSYEIINKMRLENYFTEKLDNEDLEDLEYGDIEDV
jgi:hypothetical protein